MSDLRKALNDALVLADDERSHPAVEHHEVQRRTEEHRRLNAIAAMPPTVRDLTAAPEFRAGTHGIKFVRNGRDVLAVIRIGKSQTSSPLFSPTDLDAPGTLVALEGR